MRCASDAILAIRTDEPEKLIRRSFPKVRFPSGTLHLLVAAIVLAASLLPASAHPHVWVTVRAQLVYGVDGRVSAVRHVWDFDEAYTAFTVQGLDTNKDGAYSPEELAELAKVNAESLVEFDYFTVLKANGARQEFAAPRDYAMSHDGKTLRLTFLLPLKQAASGRMLGLEVYDPTFFVAFDLAGSEDAVTLAGAPKGCALNVSRPKNLPQQSLSETLFSGSNINEGMGLQFANKAVVACP